jgi:hypothetical protein
MLEIAAALRNLLLLRRWLQFFFPLPFHTLFCISLFLESAMQ